MNFLIHGTMFNGSLYVEKHIWIFFSNKLDLFATIQNIKKSLWAQFYIFSAESWGIFMTLHSEHMGEFPGKSKGVKFQSCLLELESLICRSKFSFIHNCNSSTLLRMMELKRKKGYTYLKQSLLIF